MKKKKESIKRTLKKMRKEATTQEELYIINAWLAEIRKWEKEVNHNA